MGKTIEKNFWESRNVFITGHTGFKGSWLSLWLSSLGSNVTGYSHSLPSNPNLFTEANVEKHVASVEGDVRDLSKLQLAIEKFQPEIVIHLAAQSLVFNSFEDPLESYETNVMGTVNLFEAVRKSPNIRSVIIVTSDKCYDIIPTHRSYVESDPLGGDDPYSSSKGCAELVAAAYRRSFLNTPDGTRVATVRAGNVIGGGDWAKNRLLPDIMRAIENGRAVTIRQPEAIRPWQYVLEPLRGYLMLAEKLSGTDRDSYAEGWNFGPNETDVHSVKELSGRLAEISNGKIKCYLGENTQHQEIPALLLDSSKARTLLNWQPVLDIKESLKRTYDWHVNRQTSQMDINKFTLDQIVSYSALVAGET